MAEMKTRPTAGSVTAFLDQIVDETRRRDCRTLVGMMTQATGTEAKLWGPAMVGFGEYHYKYESGREGDWFVTGFSPRKSALTIYIMAGFTRYDDLMRRLGRYKTGKSCLYVKKLADIDLQVLEELINESVAHITRTYPA